MVTQPRAGVAAFGVSVRAVGNPALWARLVLADARDAEGIYMVILRGRELLADARDAEGCDGPASAGDHQTKLTACSEPDAHRLANSAVGVSERALGRAFSAFRPGAADRMQRPSPSTLRRSRLSGGLAQ